MRFHVVNFGCRLNSYESEALAGDLVKEGYHLTQNPLEADFLIINTCTVTARADFKNRSVIHKLHELNPKAKIIVTGCYATTDAEEIKNLPGIFAVVPNKEKALITEKITQKYTENISKNGQFGFGLPLRERVSRATLKIQDGCSRNCSYCKIPLARGKGVSRPFKETINYAQKLLDLGFQEITITGVNIGWYQGENGETFEDLIETLLNLKGHFYLRLSSLEPPEISERLIELYGHPKMAKFLHAPLQSGSAYILKLMRRSYNPSQYAKKIELIRKKVPEIHIGTDVIVGFPNENENYFQETRRFCEQMEFANIHIFPFSLRKGTEIEKRLDTSPQKFARITKNEIKERTKELAQVGEKLKKNYMKKTAYQKFRAIAEKNKATTENYVKIELSESLPLGKLFFLRYTEEGKLFNFEIPP